MEQHAEQFNFSPPDAAEAARAASPEPRISGLFPAQVRGRDAAGAPFHTETLIYNFGPAEFDLRLTRRVETGERLLVVADIHEATVALHGHVLRAEAEEDGSHRTTVAVTHHRFL